MTRGGILSNDDARWLNENINRASHIGAYVKTQPFEIPTEHITSNDRFVQIVNNTSSDLEPLQCVKIAGTGTPLSILKLNMHLAGFQETYSAVDPTDDIGRVGVAMEGIGVGRSGLAIIHGTTLARVNITHAWHGWCDTKAGESVLQTMPQGSCEIIEMEDVVGSDVLCLIRIGPPRNAIIWGETTADVNVLADATVDTFDDEGNDTTGYEITARTIRLHTKAPVISGGKNVKAEWDILASEWHLVNAECE